MSLQNGENDYKADFKVYRSYIHRPNGGGEGEGDSSYVTRFEFHKSMDTIEWSFIELHKHFQMISQRVDLQFKYIYWSLAVIGGAILTPIAERLFKFI